MREAYHDQLDSIFDDLAGICRQRRDRRPARHRGAARRRRRDRRAGDQRRRRRSTGPASGSRTRRSRCSPCSSRSPATCARSSPRCGWSASSSGWATCPCTSPRSPGCGCPTSPCPTRSGRRSSGWPRSPRTWSAGSPTIIAEPRRRGRHRARHATTRRWTSCAGRASAELLVRRLGARRRGGRRHRPAGPLLRADRRPRRLGRQPGRLRGHRRAPAPTLLTDSASASARQRPWLATAAAAAAAASGSRYSPPRDGRRSSSSSR